MNKIQENIPRDVITPDTADIFSYYGVEVPELGPGNLPGRLDFERQKALEAHHYNATHDQLTGLMNRQGLEEYLRDNKLPKAAMIVDGDGIKLINDTLGHRRGDEIIQTIAQALVASTRPSDAVFRTGGDEFTIILNPSIASGDSTFDGQDMRHGETQTNLTPQQLIDLTIERIGLKADSIVNDPKNADLQSEGIHFGMSVGGAVWQEGMSFSDLTAAADAAMYEHKTAKKNGITG